MAGHDSKVLMYDFPPKVLKRFRDDVFVVWTHDTAKLPSFLDYLNNIDETGKIKFTMQVADEVNGLEFLDLKIKYLKGKLSVDVYSKPTNSFTYVLPSTCYPMKNINKVPQGIALALRRICDTTDYKPSLVDEQFKKISKISRQDARKSKPKTNQVNKIKFVTKYNSRLPKIEGIIKKHISILHNDDALKTVFPKGCFSTIYKRNKNLKELIAPSVYPKKINTRIGSITSCNNCDICNNYIVSDNTFICTVTGKSYFIRGQLNCESINVIYLITCSKCLEQYVGSAAKFKTRFRIHKSDIKTKKERCGSDRHFNSKSYHDTNPFQYVQVQLIEKIESNSLENIKGVLWDREKYWQSQLFTITKGMNSILDLYSSKRKGCRKC